MIKTPTIEELIELYGPIDVPPPPPSREPAPYSPDDYWAPSLGPSQQRLFDSKARFVLAEGERFSGKTYGILHKIAKHCWEHVNAHVLIVVGVKRQATAGGSWHKLLTDVLPEWKRNLDGFDHSDQKQNTEKDLFVWVSNKHGGWSMVQLISIPHGASLAARIRGIEASLIFVDELVGIGGPEYFEALVQQLGRRPGIPVEEQQYFAATNPDGPSHWVYKRFHETPRHPETKEWNPKYDWFHIPISENPTPAAKAYYQNVLEAVRNDPVEYERMILGKWVDRPSGEALFATYFIPEIHQRGDRKKGTGLIPKAGFPLTLGYDLGDRNHSVVFLQERVTAEKTVWLVLDELVYTDSNVSYDMLVPELLTKMEGWCEITDHNYAFWHVSDKSAFDRFRAATGSYDHRQIEQISRDQLAKHPARYPHIKRPVKLIECPKPPGSVAARVKLLIAMLQREELFISAKCERVIDMLRYLESEKDEPFSPRRCKHLHVFDALMYPLFYNVMGGAVRASDVGNTPQLTQAGS